MHDDTAVRGTVYITRTRRFYNAVNRARAFVARRMRALDARQPAALQKFFADFGEDCNAISGWLDARAEAVHRWVFQLRKARRYGRRTAKHKRRIFVTDPVTLKLQRERFYTKATPPEKRVYQDEDSRFEGLLRRTRTWQDLHQTGSAR